MRGRIYKMTKAGTFDNSSNGSNKSTKARSTGTKYKEKGAMNTVTEEKDDGKETEVEEDGMPS